MIQEYRKASAKKCFHHKSIRYLHEIEIIEVYYNNEWHIWQPDKDANQMLMVWEWMMKQNNHWNISFNSNGYLLEASIIKPYNIYFEEGFDDIKLATMKAFMEYIKS